MRHRPHRLTGAATVGCTAAAIVVFAAGAASAVPVERDHFNFSGDEVVEDFCGDITMRAVFEFSGFFQLNRHGDGELYAVNNLRGRESITNLDNGLTMTTVSAFHNKDVKIEHNGDGTITIHARGTGVRQVRGPDGKLFSLNAAALSYDVLLSDMGTPDDPFDDEQIGDPVITKSVGRNDEEGVEFCDTVHELIG